MISPIIKLQIQAVRLLARTQTTAAQTEDVDFEELEESLWFHSIRPLVHHFFSENRTLNVPQRLRNNLAAFVNNQMLVSLTYAHEVGRLLRLFAEKKLQVLPHKGILFIHELYGNQQLREVGDMDFLFHPDSAADGMRILLSEGYKFKTHDKRFEQLPDEQLIETVLNAKGQFEVSFTKGHNLHVDFHWGLHHGFLPFKIDFDALYSTAITKDVYGVKCLIPCPEATFFMLLLHHGGKECWARIKHLADLAVFLNVYQHNFNWAAIISTAKTYKLHKQLIIGLRLLKKHIGCILPQILDEELDNYISTAFEEKRIEQFWNKAQYWDTLFPRLRKERIFVSMQDPGFTKQVYFRDFYRSYVTPNPLEQPRLINFPNNYPTLNFISKVLSYLVNKFR